MTDRLAGYVVGAIIGAGILYTSPLFPDEPLVYPEVVVPAAHIIKREPRVEVRWRERIRTVVVEPEVVARSEEGGEPEVASFCADFARARVDSALALTTEGEKIEDAPPSTVRRALLLRSGTHSGGWFWQSDDLTLTGPLSDGGLQQSTYEVRPGFSFRTNGDSVIVRSSRFWWLREGVEAAVYVGLGYLLGRAF